MRTLWLDLRQSFRALLKERLFAGMAMLTFAAGIGSAITVFAVFSAAFIRPLPFPNAPRMVYLEPRWVGAGAHQADVISAHDFMDFRERAGSFRQLAALEGSGAEIVGQYVLKTPGGPAFLASGNVTWNYFDVFGVRPLLGRGFEPRDEEAAAPGAVMLSERVWRGRFGSNPAAVGGMVELDGMPLQVVGVMPATFQFPPNADIWIPFAGARLRNFPRSVVRAVQPVGVLRDGATVESAQAELDGIAREIARVYPATNSGRGVRAVAFRSALAGGLRAPLTALFGATLLLLLISSVNVANLQLARTQGRGRDFAIRAALGAGRFQIVKQMLAETMVLAAGGAMLGLVLAGGALKLLAGWMPAGTAGINAAEIDWRVVVSASILMTIAALAAGMAPAAAASSVSLQGMLRDGSAGSSRRMKQLDRLAAVEVALAMVLLVAAGLMTRSFQQLNTAEHGLHDPGRVSTLLLTFPPATYPRAAERIRTQAEILRRVQQLPGVEAAGFAYTLPMRGVTFTGLFQFGGRGADDVMTTDIHWVSPGALEAMGVPLIRGRWFRPDEGADTASHAVLVNREFVRRYVPAREPIGATLAFVPGAALTVEEVAGVVGDVRHRSLDRTVTPAVYKSSLSMQWCYLLVRASRANLELDRAVAREVRAVASDQPVSAMPPLTAVIQDSMSGQRYRTRLVVLFGSVALLLAAIGIYGVVAYSMSRRTREIAVRLAVGATPRDVFRLVLREGAGIALAGILAGLALARVAAQAISSLLYGVSAGYAPAYLGTAVGLAAVVILACLIPAWRAATLEPAAALKEG